MRNKYKKIVSLCIIIFVFCLSMVGCGSEQENHLAVSKIRQIGELATEKCYFHNVAEGKKSSQGGIFHFFEKDRKFWIEYTGIVRLGVDVKKLKMSVNGEKVQINIPDAEILSMSIGDFNENSYYISEDGLIDSNEITNKEQKKAMRKAKKKMKKQIIEDGYELPRAQERAKKLLANYIHGIGDLTGVDYKITWIYENGEKEKEVV